MVHEVQDGLEVQAMKIKQNAMTPEQTEQTFNITQRDHAPIRLTRTSAVVIVIIGRTRLRRE